MEPFHDYQYAERTVHLELEWKWRLPATSAPPGWIGRRVQMQWGLALGVASVPGFEVTTKGTADNPFLEKTGFGAGSS